jgi:hypothetical protein
MKTLNKQVNYLTAKRADDETFESYKLRMREINKAIKRYLQGRTAWDPRLPIPVIERNEDGSEKKNDKGEPVFLGEYLAGTYNKQVHGAI